MNEELIEFLSRPSKASFLKIRSLVVAHNDYNPYSNDLSLLDQYIGTRNYNAVLDYNNINILLSPRAHMLKSIAFSQKGMEFEAKSALFIGTHLIKGISLTGKGTRTEPYLVTRIHDEKDFIEYTEARPAAQSLINEGSKTCDRITLSNGSDLYFDITDCYRKKHAYTSCTTRQMHVTQNESQAGKKWWQFW